MEKRKYDSTVARIAGNILSGEQMSGTFDELGRLSHHDTMAVTWSVKVARAIVAEVERTEPPLPEPPK